MNNTSSPFADNADLAYNVDANAGMKRPRKPRSNSEGNSSDSSFSTTTTDQSLKQQVSPSPNRRRGRRSKKRGSPKHPGPRLSLEQANQYLAMDCEMVGVGSDGRTSMLARVVLMNWHGTVLLDEFIQPTRVVTDYRTFVSGITELDLLGEQAITLDSCRRQVAELIQNKKLIGHALKNDLHALGIAHPWHLLRDTAKYEPFMKVRFDDGVLWPRKLRDLVKEYCNRDIQIIGQAHCPLEDAWATLELYKTVQAKWEKVMAYKVNKTKEIELHKTPILSQ